MLALKEAFFKITGSTLMVYHIINEFVQTVHESSLSHFSAVHQECELAHCVATTVELGLSLLLGNNINIFP